MNSKKVLFWLAIFMMFMAPQRANAQFWKQLGKVAEGVGKAVLESATTPTTDQSQSRPPSATGKRIVTGHPDFKIEIKRCAASGTTVVLDMVVTNVGDYDISQFEVRGSGWETKLYDNLGNIYEAKDIYVKIANKDYVTGINTIKLVSNLPTNFTIKAENISDKATSFVLVEPHVYSPEWGITKSGAVKLRNIPISREEE